ncbi:MAG: hypothetical protein ACKOBD_15930, partial [Chloroflexota bacterium]
MKASSLIALTACLAVLITSCGTPAPAQAPQSFVLVTSAPNASPTPTPFQPSLATPTLPILLASNSNPAPQLIFPTETFFPTVTPQASPTATAPIEQLFPTQAAPPPAEALLVNPTPLPPLTTENETINFLLIGSDRRPTGNSHR